MSKFENSTYLLLLQVAIRARHDFAKKADAHDLTLMQLITLCSLKPGEAAPMNSISGVLVCDASNVTGIVDRLVQRGYILRQESPEDRRVKAVRLTASGEKLRSKVVTEISDAQPESMSLLSPDEFAMLHTLLKKALGN